MAFPNVTAMPGPLNVFIPTFQGKQTARLIKSFARDPKKFAVNGFTTRTPVEYLSGLWYELRPEALARVFQDPNAYLWVDGQPFPQGNHNSQDARAVRYQCLRRAMPDYLGEQTKDQAIIPLQETKIDALGHMMMTLRSKVFYTTALDVTALGTPGHHLSSHVKTATQWSSLNGATGGGWQQGTGENPIIKRTLLNVGDQVTKDTMATVTYKDLSLVISPSAAIQMGTSEEIHYFLARSPYALAQLRGDKPSQNGQWGLPDRLYDMNLVVDPTLQTTSGRMDVPGTESYLLDTNTALFMAAPGAIADNVGQVNSNFSSFHMFVYKGEEMVVKTLFDPWNQYTKLGIYETYGISMVSPETTALATSLFT